MPGASDWGGGASRQHRVVLSVGYVIDDTPTDIVYFNGLSNLVALNRENMNATYTI